MKRRGDDAFVSPSDETLPIEPEETIISPRFDEKSVQRARPAVPLAEEGRRRGVLPVNVIVLCLVALLAGGALGVVVLSLLRRDGARVEPGGAPSQSGVPVSLAARGGGATESAPVETAGRSEGNAAGEVEASSGAAGEGAVVGGAREELRGALEGWLAATNARDLGRQMSFYDSTMSAFYLSRNASREDVRAEKARAFGSASAIEVRADEPDISLSRDGRTAVMRFRKKYSIEGGGQGKRGEVLQELRWRRTQQGWRIVSERDLRVIQ